MKIIVTRLLVWATLSLIMLEAVYPPTILLYWVNRVPTDNGAREDQTKAEPRSRRITEDDILDELVDAVRSKSAGGALPQPGKTTSGLADGKLSEPSAQLSSARRSLLDDVDPLSARGDMSPPPVPKLVPPEELRSDSTTQNLPPPRTKQLTEPRRGEWAVVPPIVYRTWSPGFRPGGRKFVFGLPHWKDNSGSYKEVPDFTRMLVESLVIGLIGAGLAFSLRVPGLRTNSGPGRASLGIDRSVWNPTKYLFNRRARVRMAYLGVATGLIIVGRFLALQDSAWTWWDWAALLISFAAATLLVSAVAPGRYLEIMWRPRSLWTEEDGSYADTIGGRRKWLLLLCFAISYALVFTSYGPIGPP